MIENILVTAAGSSTDDAVFATALAAAQPLAAHLEFYHVQPSDMEAAVRAPHVDFCVGAALPIALNALRDKESDLSDIASAHVQSFGSRHSVPMRVSPARCEAVPASFLEEQGHARDRLMLHSRHSDLVVLGRPSHLDYLPPMLMEDLTLTGTVVVGWKETPESARALGAAWPLLEKANKLILLHVVEDQPSVPSSLEHLALVGGFGHSRLRERAFGGVTQSLLEHANVPVFMMH